MPKFRKKPVVIDAELITENTPIETLEPLEGYRLKVRRLATAIISTLIVGCASAPPVIATPPPTVRARSAIDPENVVNIPPQARIVNADGVTALIIPITQEDYATIRYLAIEGYRIPYTFFVIVEEPK